VATLVRPAGPLDDETGLHLVTLNDLLIQLLGPDYLTWEWEALYVELVERNGGEAIGPTTWERIQAGRVMLANKSFWRDWEVFEKCTSTIVGLPAVFSLSQPPEGEDIAIAIRTAELVASGEWSDEVKGYMAAALLDEGMWYVEKPLDVVEEAITNHDARHGIARNFGPVAELLETTNDYVKDPDNFAEVQVNHVISVRKALQEFNLQVGSQRASLPKFLEAMQ
jgi:hypothetical protein